MAGLDYGRLGMMALVALGAACSAQGGATTGLGNAGGASSAGGGTTTSRSATTTTAAVTTGSAGVGGAGGGACTPPPDSIYAQTAVYYGDPGPSTLCEYQGDVLLIVNTAAV